MGSRALAGDAVHFTGLHLDSLATQFSLPAMAMAIRIQELGLVED